MEVVECLYRFFSACSLPLNPTIQPMSFWVSRACLRTSRTKVACWLCFIRLEVLLSTLYLLLLVSDFHQSRFEDRYMGVTTLARLPFRLGLGRVMDAIVIFRPLRPICILVRTRILFCFMYDLNLCMYFDSWLVESSWLLYILLWVPSWTCVTLLYWFHPHNVYVETCIFCLVVRFQSDIMRIVAWML
jgi:hypothetical protein